MGFAENRPESATVLQLGTQAVSRSWCLCPLRAKFSAKGMALDKLSSHGFGKDPEQTRRPHGAERSQTIA